VVFALLGAASALPLKRMRFREQMKAKVGGLCIVDAGGKCLAACTDGQNEVPGLTCEESGHKCCVGKGGAPKQESSGVSCFAKYVVDRGEPVKGVDDKTIALKKAGIAGPAPGNPAVLAKDTAHVTEFSKTNYELGTEGTPYVGVLDTTNGNIHLYPQPIVLAKKVTGWSDETESATYAEGVWTGANRYSKETMPKKFEEADISTAETATFGFPAAAQAKLKLAEDKAYPCVIFHNQGGGDQYAQPGLTVCDQVKDVAGHEQLRQMAGVAEKKAIGFTIYKYDAGHCKKEATERAGFPFLYFSGTSRSQNQNFYEWSPRKPEKFSGAMLPDAAELIYNTLCKDLGIDCTGFVKKCA